MPPVKRHKHHSIKPIKNAPRPRKTNTITATAQDNATATPVAYVPNNTQPATSTIQTNNVSTMRRYSGARNFRERLLCSTLSGMPIRIDQIRETPVTNIKDVLQSGTPGLRDYEISFLRLLEKVTNGTTISISPAGTAIKYIPGTITGGGSVSGVLGFKHVCPTSRGIGYYVEPIIKLLLFAKAPTDITFEGVTNNDIDLSVDVLKTVTLPLIRRFLDAADAEALQVKCVKRGAAPGGGGVVQLHVPSIKALNTLQMVDEGLVKRVRGLAYTTKCSPQFANRMVDAARGILNNLIPDVYIYTDHYKGKDSGNSAGYAVSLVAETTSGCLISSEQCGNPNPAVDGKVDDNSSNSSTAPEVVGELAAKVLLDEIAKGGCIDSTHQSTALLMMVLCSEDVSKVRLGRLSQHTVQSLRLYKDFFSTQFKLVAEPKTQCVFASCLGIGYKNYARRAA